MKHEILEHINQTIEQGPFKAQWDSLENYQIPDWYEDAKFGIFIHWGLYAVPAFGNEWYPRHMYIEGSKEYQHHIETYGPQNEFGYKDFIPLFTAENFNPQEWAELFKKSGARFIVPVAEHHDGFQMYQSKLSKWNAAEMGPKRDIIGELAQAVRDENLIFGVSSHRAEHWFFFDGGRKFDSDVNDPLFEDFYGPAQPSAINWNDLTSEPPSTEFLDDWLVRTSELVEKYQPQLVWFDWWIQHLAFKPYLKKFWAYYYNKAEEWNKGVAINYKYDACPTKTAVFDVERGQLSGGRGLYWQTDTSVSKNSWGYIQDHDYKQSEDIICDLVDIVSKNGALLLNIGPRADGTIPEQEATMLLEIGNWLETHGEAIYETRPWITFGEGPTKVMEGAFTDTIRTIFTSADIRFTMKGKTLYAFVLAWPEDGKVSIQFKHKNESILPDIENIELLGIDEKVDWSTNAQGLEVRTAVKGRNPYPRALKMRLK